MHQDQIAKAVHALVEARRGRRSMAALPADCAATSAADGYAIQKGFVAAWGEPIAGWKSGATARPVQEKFGLNEPFLGPIFKSTVLASPVTAKAADFEHRKDPARPGIALEVEFAFRVGRDLGAKAGGYSEAEVLDAMDAVVPAFEIISPRYHVVPFGTPGAALADCGVNGGIVLGKPVTQWREIDYPNHKTRHLIDGKVAAEGTGALVLGHPFKSLHWLVNGVIERGYTLTKGQILTTGSMSGIVYADQGTTSVADFGNLGQVTIKIV